MKILITDDHALFRDGLSLKLEQIVPEATIFQAASFTQALKLLDEGNKMDLIIIDLDMPDMPWAKGFELLRAKAQGSKFVVISASEDNKDIRKIMEGGASGYIPKRSEPNIIAGALKFIIDGGTYLPPSILESANSYKTSGTSVEKRKKGKLLTPRQKQVLELIAQGMSNKQIAYEMHVSEATIKLHINALLKAIGATNRTQAVITAQKMGII